MTTNMARHTNTRHVHSITHESKKHTIFEVFKKLSSFTEPESSNRSAPVSPGPSTTSMLPYSGNHHFHPYTKPPPHHQGSFPPLNEGPECNFKGIHPVPAQGTQLYPIPD
jgi:hypothetical protein